MSPPPYYWTSEWGCPPLPPLSGSGRAEHTGSLDMGSSRHIAVRLILRETGHHNYNSVGLADAAE